MEKQFERYSKAYLAAALCALSYPVSAADNCGCSLPTPRDGYEQVSFDSRDGKLLQGQSVYKKETGLDIYFQHENNFNYLYSYSYTSKSQEDEQLKAALSKIFLKSDTNQDADTESEAIDKIASDTGFLDGSSCTVKDEVASFANHEITKSIASFVQEPDVQVTFMSQVGDEPSCQKLCTSAQAIVAKNKLQPQEMVKLTQLAKELQRRIESVDPTLEAMLEEPECQQEKETFETLKKLPELAQKKIDDNSSFLDEVNEFTLHSKEKYSRLVIPKSTAPMTHEIKIHRVAKDDSKEETFTNSLKIGSSRFSYSVGMGISFIKQYEYGVGNTNVGNPTVAEGETAPTADKFVKITEQSDESIGVVGQLNGRVYSWSSASFGWSVGASLTTSETDTNFGFYTGPNIALLDDSLFFTLAYHVQKVTKPDMGYEPNAILKPDFDGSIPTRNKTDSGLLLTVTWRFDD